MIQFSKTLNFVCLLIYLFWSGVTLHSPGWPRNFWSSCLSLQSVGITDMHPTPGSKIL
jgi:hypothetical protein